MYVGLVAQRGWNIQHGSINGGGNDRFNGFDTIVATGDLRMHALQRCHSNGEVTTSTSQRTLTKTSNVTRVAYCFMATFRNLWLGRLHERALQHSATRASQSSTCTTARWWRLESARRRRYSVLLRHCPARTSPLFECFVVHLKVINPPY
jgi:hypothetical protein